MPLVALLLAALGVPTDTAPAAQAAGAKPPPRDAMAPSGWSFRLKPKSFQENPDLAMTVITELTPEGRKRPEASPTAPAYYGMQSLGLKTYGAGDPGKIIVPAERIRKLMQTALEENGYLTAGPGHPPTLALEYQWGLHGVIPDADAGEIAMLRDRAEEGLSLSRQARARRRLEPEFPTPEDIARGDEVVSELEQSPEIRMEWLTMNIASRKNLVQRAALVGGQQFAHDLDQILENSLQAAVRARTESIFFPEMSQGPLRSLLKANPKASRLFSQAAFDVYFVIVMAFDFDEYVRGERRALWRTSMTVNTEGVSMLESLPSVIAAAAPHFGREMSESATLLQSIDRGNTIEIGPLRVVGEAPDAPAKSEKK